jgi:cobalt-zinc-cadmium efflux system membrane fusion protein
MKWAFRGLVTLILCAIVTGLCVAWARPGWLPAEIRPHAERLFAWADFAGASDDDDDDRPKTAAPPELFDDGWCEARKSAGPRRKADAKDDCRRLLPIVRLASADVARRIGLETEQVALERHAHRLICNAETAYDARRSAEIIPRVAGVLHEVRADLGRLVCKGEVLAVVDSAQVGAAKAQYLSARATVELAQATYDRTLKLTQAKAAPAKSELEHLTALTTAKNGLRDAEQKLRNLSFDDAGLERIVRTEDTTNLLSIIAPIDGTIIVWDATRGEAVEPTTQLFGMADTSRMWLWIDVYEADIIAVAPGQPVRFVISGTETPVFEGKVTWMGTEVNPQTRTTRVRAELVNPDGRLRANQFGRATIQVAPEHEAVIVPRSAVQNDGQDDLVFLAQADGRFRPQRIATMPTEDDERLEVTWGLKPGQRVVTTRSFLLKSEMFKDRLGAADND